MKRSVCLLTHQRSGSEVVMRYFSAAGFDSAGELLCQFPAQDHGLKRTARSADDAPFAQKWHLGPVGGDGGPAGRWDFLVRQVHERVKVITEHHSPVIVKAFTSSSFFIDNLRPYELLFDKLDVVVLRRRDSWKVALSSEICNMMSTWHVTEAEAPLVRERLATLRFIVSEPSFLHTIRALNTLKVLHGNIEKMGGRHRAITYEDFADSPRERLNELLGRDVGIFGLPTKFIDDHESHVENIDRLRQLYERYALKD